jgi:16S rRNA (cytosine967-C5)-methyltransferase
LDWFIDQFVEKRKKRIDPVIRNILRLGLYQIFFLDRIPTSAAVNTAVNLAKSIGRPWTAGFVNGLLRRAAGHKTLWDRCLTSDDDPVAMLSIQQSFPPWMLKRWYQRFGFEQTSDMCRRMNTIPDLTIRTNTLRTDRGTLMDAVSGEASSLSVTLHSPEGIRLHSPRKTLDGWNSYQHGWFQVQDEAAQLVSHVVSPEPGHRVWDVCAGLGTKTAHMAQLMGNQGNILSTDRQSSKLKSLDMEMVRLGITIVDSRPLDLLQSPPTTDTAEFDRILVDAPCSGIGVLQKNPDGKWRLRPRDLKRYADHQFQLLDHAAPYLKPSGILVYAVCSIETDENEQVVRRFLSQRREFSIHRPVMPKVSDAEQLITSEEYFYTLPHRHQMDGFFCVALKRNA